MIFVFQAIIVKACGKKTPLVRRRRRRKVVKHDVDSDIEEVARVEEVVHPAAVKDLPFGKAKRKGVDKNKKADPTVVECHLAGVQIGSRNTTTEENVARANELAANLNQVQKSSKHKISTKLFYPNIQPETMGYYLAQRRCFFPQKNT